MFRPPPRSTRTVTLFPYPALFRSPAHLPPLCLKRPERGGDRRGGQEGAGDRLRRGGGPWPWPERPRGADQPGLCRDVAVRRGPWRAAGNAGGPVRPWRSGADLLLAILAQFQPGLWPWQGRERRRADG